MSKNQKAYLKELKRLRRGYTRYSKLGAVPFRDLGLEIPQRVTKRKLEEIKRTKPIDIALFMKNSGDDLGTLYNYAEYEQYLKEQDTIENRKQELFDFIDELSSEYERDIRKDTIKPIDNGDTDVYRFLNALIMHKNDTSYGSDIYFAADKQRWLQELIDLTNDVIDLEGSKVLGQRLRQNTSKWENILEQFYHSSKGEEIIVSINELFKVIQGTDLTPEQEDMLQEASAEFLYNDNYY